MKLNNIFVIVILLLSSCDIYAEWDSDKYPPIGRDTVMVMGDGRFRVNRYYDTNIFDMEYPKGSGHSTAHLLSDVDVSRRRHNKVYIHSKYGCAVVNEKDDTCMLYIAEEKPLFDAFRGYEQGLTFLNSYEEFNQEDKKVFEKILRKN